MALLRAADGLLDVRKGQTELSIAMADMAKITPAVTICEMLDDESGYALTKADAKTLCQEARACLCRRAGSDEAVGEGEEIGIISLYPQMVE